MYPHELAVWRENAINGLAQPGEKRLTAAEAKQEKRRVKELEREIRRKDKALAEAAALLVLSKKAEAIFSKYRAEDERSNSKIAANWPRTSSRRASRARA